MRRFKLTTVVDKHAEWFAKERMIERGFWEWPIQYILGYGVCALKILIA